MHWIARDADGRAGAREFILQPQGTDLAVEGAVGIPENKSVFSVRRGDCWIPVPSLLSLEEATIKSERNAVNQRRRAEKKCPLFSDQVSIDEISPEDIVERSLNHALKELLAATEDARKSTELRDRVQTLVTPEEFAILVEKRSSYPSDVVYGQIFWNRHLKSSQKQENPTSRRTYPH